MTISTVSTQSPEINIQHNQGSQQISGKLGEKSISTTATSIEASNLAQNHEPISDTPKKDLKVLFNESQFNKEKDTKGFSFQLLEVGDNGFKDSVTRRFPHHKSEELKSVVTLLKTVQETPSENNLSKLENELTVWKEKNPKEAQNMKEVAHELQSEIKGLTSTIKANRAKDAGVFNLSIDPQKAALFPSSSVNFDQHGRVEGLGQISLAQIEELKSSTTTPLTELNSMAERKAPKTESESIIEFAFKFSESSDPKAQELANEAKSLWMSGGVNKDSLTNLLEKAKASLANDEPLQSVVSKQISDVQKEKYNNQYGDGLFNRHFDTEIAHEMVDKPSKAALDNAKQIGEYLFNDFSTRSKEKKETQTIIDFQLRNFAARIGAEIRPWYSEVPEVTTFIDDPTMGNFEKMMCHVENGFDMIKIPFLAVKLLNGHLGFGAAQHKHDADKFYQQTVVKARTEPKEDVTPVETPQTNHYGTRLSYQPKEVVYEDFISGKSVPDSKVLGQKLSQHDKNAFENGATVVTGASGSTNIMTFLSKHLAKENNNFSEKQSQLNTLAFLTFDGGHSLNESMSVYTALQEEGDDRVKKLNEYHINYQKDVIALAKQDNQAGVADAIENAYTSTLKLYKEKAYSSPQNTQMIRV